MYIFFIYFDLHVTSVDCAVVKSPLVIKPCQTKHLKWTHPSVFGSGGGILIKVA